MVDPNANKRNPVGIIGNFPMWDYNHPTPAAFAQRVIYPVRMSNRDYVNANMWDGKYPENFDQNVAGNAASRSQQGLAQHRDTDIIEKIKRDNSAMRGREADMEKNIEH